MARQSTGAALVVAAACLWGFWPVWVRAAGSGETVAAFALTISGAVAVPLALMRRRKLGDAGPRGRAWVLLVLLGLANAANTWLYFRALAEGLVAPAVLSHYLAPVLVALVAPALLGEPRSARTPPAIALALVGTALLLGERGLGGAPAAVTHAVLLGGLSALFYAASVLLSKKAAVWFGDLELFAYHSLLAGLVLLPAAGLPPGPRSWGAVVGGALVSGLCGGVIYYAGLRRIPAERASVLLYVETLAAVLVGWMALGERPSVWAVVGGALVLTGGLLVVSAAGSRRTVPGSPGEARRR